MWLAHTPVSCQALPCVEDAGHWWAGLGHEAADCGLVVLGLVLAHWWLELGSGVGTVLGSSRYSVGLQVGGASSRHSWLQGLGCPKACVGPLVRGARSWGSWLRGPECLGAGISQLVARLGPGVSGCKA